MLTHHSFPVEGQLLVNGASSDGRRNTTQCLQVSFECPVYTDWADLDVFVGVIPVHVFKQNRRLNPDVDVLSN